MYTAPLARLYNQKDKPLSINKQIQNGFLCCPQSRSKLNFGKNGISSPEGINYPLIKGTPVLLKNTPELKSYISQSKQMCNEYEEYSSSSYSMKLKKKLLEILNYSWQTKESILAHRQTYVDEQGLCLAIGGGPSRSHPRAVNINISHFVNVDIVADAHCMPYSNNVVDSIICEDVLEHLLNPDLVVKEMNRILKPGGVVYSCTPFLIPYHGYPNHYQNYTLQGHKALYQKYGFEVIKSGTCYGPLVTFLSFIGFMLSIYVPPFLGLKKVFCRSWTVLSFFLKPIDRLFQMNNCSEQLSFSTFALVRKKTKI